MAFQRKDSAKEVIDQLLCYFIFLNIVNSGYTMERITLATEIWNCHHWIRGTNR